MILEYYYIKFILFKRCFEKISLYFIVQMSAASVIELEVVSAKVEMLSVNKSLLLNWPNFTRRFFCEYHVIVNTR